MRLGETQGLPHQRGKEVRHLFSLEALVEACSNSLAFESSGSKKQGQFRISPGDGGGHGI